MAKPVVGVIFGSRSTEHDVSIITALASIIPPLEASKQYDVVPVYITKDGRWYSDKQLKDITLYTSGAIDTWIQKHEPVLLSLNGGPHGGSQTDLRGGLSLVHRRRHRSAFSPLSLFTRRSQRISQEIKLDVVFPATHGTHGEDGELMGVLEMAGVPYVGCGVAASAVAMDKLLTKLVAQASGIRVTPFVYFSKEAFESDPDDWITKINRKLHYPLFVKPAHLGSSIGIARVTDPKDLRNAIEVAIHYDDKVLVEEAVQNLIEVTLPIMGSIAGSGQPRPALLEQPLTKGEDFFDFTSKYMHGGKKGGKQTGSSASGSKTAGVKGAQGYSAIPADLPGELYAQAEATGLAVYSALGCEGLARVDMLIDSKTKAIYCNEVNPLPGSLYQHNWQRAGVSNVELVNELIALALERHNKRTKLETAFATNFLKQF